ncbi:MAG: hypothetical protein BM556_08300 [Bacteriovorax sp. MedPE-SWde]|nr:MAG: hypothetical protein BM556_08300 [Bacteriovorax sp. MedPE-SWde]
MNLDNKTQRLKVYYFQITDIWKRHCELHSELFDLTCDEYALLLESDLDNLEEKITQKNNLIATIKLNDEERSRLLTDLAKAYPESKIEKVTDLITFFGEFPAEKESKHLFRFNALLLDIISKIQTQNKKNQLFINKAINSLRNIREEATGTTTVSTYNAKGVRSNRTLEQNA